MFCRLTNGDHLSEARSDGSDCDRRHAERAGFCDRKNGCSMSPRHWYTSLLRRVRAARELVRTARGAERAASADQGRKRYTLLADALPQLVAIVDRQLLVMEMNESCRRYTGQTLAFINDTSAAWIVRREDGPQLAAARAAIDADADFACELRLRRADGVSRRHSVRAVPLTPAAGERPSQWMLTATDMEDVKAAGTMLEADRLLAMVEAMTRVGHYRIDLTSNAAYWSDEVYRMYGLPATFTPTLAWVMSAYHPDDRDRVVGIMRQTLADGQAFTFDARIVRPDGTIRAVVAGGQVERTADGKFVGLFGVLQDVTTIRDGERERAKLSERVLLATKAGGIGIWEWNVAVNVLDWDTAMYVLYGVADRATVPSYDAWINCIHPADRGRTETEITRALDGAPFDIEFRAIWPTGEIRHLRAMGTLVHDPAGIGSRMVGASWDITEIRVLANDLREQKDNAQEASRAKSEFLARMSHEIRTPMNGIIGFTTLVLDGELSAEQRRYMSLLRDAGRSLLAIINDILDFSKLEAGKIELECIPLNLNALVDGALSIVRNEALPKGILLDEKLAPDVPAWVNGDPTRLRQTLLNLLTNALKFTDRGSIRVTVRRELPPQDACIRFEIADTGIGIAPDQRHLLFRDFSQLEKSTTRLYGGTGLGLAICKHLVEAMGGTIGVESEPGSGSVFWFTAKLPEVGVPALDTRGESPRIVVPRRILVADDNHVNQIVVQSLLLRDGHTVVLVSDGAEAVEAVRTSTFDLVFMDMQMPIMDGVAASRAIRDLPAPLGTIPIVALTANAMAEQVELCNAAGMNAHLSKPIDRELLRQAVARWTQPPAAIAAFRDTPTLGIAALAELFDGDLQRVGAIFDAALASIECDLRRIEQSATTCDMVMVAQAAHRIKGTSGSIRSQHIMTISASLEQAAKRGPQSVDPQLLRALVVAVAEFRDDVATHHRGVLRDEGR